MKLSSVAVLCAVSLACAYSAEARSRHHPKPVPVTYHFRSSATYVRVAEVCSFGFWCNYKTALRIDKSAPPPISPKAKMARVIDRSQFRYELEYFPELIRKLAWMVNGEVGKLAPLPVKIVQAETAFNRAQARGQSLTQVLLSVGEDPRDGYYAIDTYCHRAEPSDEDVLIFAKAVIDPIMRGSNLSDVGYGPMTGNASAGVAAHQFARGTPGYQLQAGDAYFREGPFINEFPEISPNALVALGLSGINDRGEEQ